MSNFNRNDKPGFKRDFGRNNFGKPRFSDRGERSEMHKAVCDKCGKNCEIPFKPSMGKPVYCRECFTKNNEGGENRFQDRSARRPDYNRQDHVSAPRGGQLEAIERKLDKIIKILTAPVVAIELVKDIEELKEEKKGKQVKPKIAIPTE